MFNRTIAVATLIVFLVAAAAFPEPAAAQCELHKLLAKDGVAGDTFGWSVAISGNVAIVGAYGDTDNGFQSGSAYLFYVNTGQQIAKLLPLDGAAHDWFGLSVAISGDTAIVGAYGDDDNGGSSGSAYLFDVNTGQQITKLLPLDGARDDNFGYSVSITGDTAIVGSYADDDNGSNSGSAYLFNVTTGQQIAKLLPLDGARDDNFGYSVAINGDTAIVGSYGDDDNGSYSGSAYLFDINTGQQVAKLLPEDGAAYDGFGYSVAISGDTAIVGARYDDDNGPHSGSAYLFDITTGQQIAKLRAQDGAAGDSFGYSVSIGRDTAIVGAHGDDNSGSDSGSAYLFDVNTGQQIAKLLPQDGAAEDYFGFSVAIGGDTAIVGARTDDDNGGSSGSAYLFSTTAGASTRPLDIVSPPIVNGEASTDPVAYTPSVFAPLNGFAADGVTRIVARIGVCEAGSVTFKLRDETNQTSTEVGTIRRLNDTGENTNQIAVDTVNIDGQDWAFAILQSPIDFARDSGDWDDPYRIIKLTAEFTPDGGGAPISPTLNIQLHRPPVLLLHGLWSSGSTFRWDIQDDPRFHVYEADHDGFSGIYNNTSVTQVIVDATLDSFVLDTNVAATQVDCIGHSLGGLLLRLYAGEYWPKFSYYRDDNYNEGDINRLITLDTPHFGARLAHILVTETNELKWTGRRVEQATDLEVDGGAIRDMRLDSDVLETITAARVPVHAIVGKGGSDLIQEGALTLVGSGWLKAVIKAVQLLDTILIGRDIMGELFPPNMQHDLVISRPNQEGRLANQHVTRYGYSVVPPFGLGIHTSVTKEDRVNDRIVALLNARTTDSTIFAPEFPAAGGLYGEEPPPEFPDLRDEVDGLVITDPLGGEKVVAGGTIEVTVETQNGFIPEGVLVSSQFETIELLEPPYVATLQIPVEALGELRIGAFGIDAQLDYAEPPVVLLTIETDANLLSMSVRPAPIYLFDYLPTRTLRITGLFDDNIERDISGSALGTTYESADARIAIVDAEGMVRGICVGETTVIVRNGTVEAMVPVEVVSTPAPSELTAFRLQLGSLLSGELLDICVSDDLYLKARSQFGFLSSEPNILDLRIEAVTDVEPVSSMNLTIEAKLNNPNGNVKLRLRNWNTNALSQVHEYVLGTTEISENVNVPNADVFVRDADGLIELSIKQVVIATFSTSGFVASFDYVGIAVE